MDRSVWISNCGISARVLGSPQEDREIDGSRKRVGDQARWAENGNIFISSRPPLFLRFRIRGGERMSKRSRSISSMPSPPPETEKFLAILLWAQRGECNCVACEYFRSMGSGMMERHITEEGLTSE